MVLSTRRKIETLSNIAITIASLLFIAVLLKNLINSYSKDSLPNNVKADKRLDKRSLTGKKVNITDVDWSKYSYTLLVALQPKCQFCTESAPFYKQLAEKQPVGSDIKLIVLSPSPVNVTKSYLNTLGISIQEVRQISLDSIGIAGTPTLLLVDRSGTIKDLWFGRLKQEQEAEVYAQLRQ